jgi:acyl-CoA thioesterase FadM
MSSSISTRWSVVQEHDVAPEDLDAGATVAAPAVARWIDDARTAYLAQCTRLERVRASENLVLRAETRGGDRSLPAAPGVVVSASATEVLPTAFVIAIRIRTLGGDDDAVVNATCVVRLEDAAGAARPIDDELRDELIALEHAARHFN